MSTFGQPAPFTDQDALTRQLVLDSDAGRVAQGLHLTPKRTTVQAAGGSIATTSDTPLVSGPRCRSNETGFLIAQSRSFPLAHIPTMSEPVWDLLDVAGGTAEWTGHSVRRNGRMADYGNI